MKFSVRSLYKKLLMEPEFRKDQHRLSHSLLPGIREFVLATHIYVTL